jgi:hypothetical protein
MFVGYIEDEQYVLGKIGNGIVPAVQKMISLRTEHFAASGFTVPSPAPRTMAGM